jgi:hypothetical protein
LVYVVAIAFILAPFGNIAFSLQGLNVPAWYTPAKIWLGFIHSPIWDKTWLILDLITGILLLRPRKYTWGLALATLSISTGFNFYNGFLATGFNLFSWGALASSLSAGVILYYFRYPYLDRRESWWGISQRHSISLPAKLKFDGFEISGLITNISRTGAFFTANEKREHQINLTTQAELHIGEISIIAKIERLSTEGYGMAFRTKLNKSYLESITRK